MREEFNFRFMATDDISDVMVIEEDVHLSPWTESIFADCLRVAYHAEVMECEGEIVGYFVLSVAAGEAHLFNVCVSREWQGKGLGRMMIGRCIDVARIREADSVFLEVRPSNKNAIHLYESEGFCEVGVRKEYYPGAKGREDALVFAKHL